LLPRRALRRRQLLDAGVLDHFRRRHVRFIVVPSRRILNLC
jgi:hypothetical protein